MTETVPWEEGEVGLLAPGLTSCNTAFLTLPQPYSYGKAVVSHSCSSLSLGSCDCSLLLTLQPRGVADSTIAGPRVLQHALLVSLNPVAPL